MHPNLYHCEVRMGNYAASSLGWLLEEDNPSVRYFTLTDLLDRPRDDPDVLDARRAIMELGAVPEFLEKMRTSEYQKDYPRFYALKYTGLVWSLIALAELNAQSCPEIRAVCEYLLENAQEKTDGGFAMNTSAMMGGGRITEVIPCLTGNMVFALARLGYSEDPRFKKSVSWLTRFMKYNDGEALDPQVPPYDHSEPCWGSHTCFMGAVKALKGLAEIPPEARTKEIQEAIDRAAEFLLIHHIDKRSHDLARVAKPGWRRFGFPLMYQTDVLEILDLLTALGYHDERMREAVEFFSQKQAANGRWHAENVYPGDRLLVPFKGANAPGKWLTLRALSVLKRWENE